MSVRAKFTYQSYTTSREPIGKHADGKYVVTGYQEKRTMRFSPVFHNNVPGHENAKFWEYSPSGMIELGTVNPAAWEYFKLGGEYYIDFTEASPPPEIKPAD
jgi:hypothetical protein